MRVTLDSSMCMASCFEAERTPAVLAVVEEVIGHGAWAPPLWQHEIGNGFLSAQRRQRISEQRRLALLAAWSDFATTEDRERL